MYHLLEQYTDFLSIFFFNFSLNASIKGFIFSKSFYENTGLQQSLKINSIYLFTCLYRFFGKNRLFLSFFTFQFSTIRYKKARKKNKKFSFVHIKRMDLVQFRRQILHDGILIGHMYKTIVLTVVEVFHL